MSFKIEDDNVYLSYSELWNKIKKASNIRFHSQPIYGRKYIKTKVKTFNCVINTAFSNNEIQKEKNHFICIACLRFQHGYFFSLEKLLFIGKCRTEMIPQGTMKLHFKDLRHSF